MAERKSLNRGSVWASKWEHNSKFNFYFILFKKQVRMWANKKRRTTWKFSVNRKWSGCGCRWRRRCCSCWPAGRKLSARQNARAMTIRSKWHAKASPLRSSPSLSTRLFRWVPFFFRWKWRRTLPLFLRVCFLSFSYFLFFCFLWESPWCCIHKSRWRIWFRKSSLL